jgi:hypothetical protein
VVDKIDLAAVIGALRAEVARAATQGKDEAIRFTVKDITLDFQVGVTTDHDRTAGVRFWVMELSATDSYTSESIQRVSITLTPSGPDGPTQLTERFG